MVTRRAREGRCEAHPDSSTHVRSTQPRRCVFLSISSSVSRTSICRRSNCAALRCSSQCCPALLIAVLALPSDDSPETAMPLQSDFLELAEFVLTRTWDFDMARIFNVSHESRVI